MKKEGMQLKGTVSYLHTLKMINLWYQEGKYYTIITKTEFDIWEMS